MDAYRTAEGGHGGPVQDLAHGRETIPSEAPAASLSTVPVQGRETDLGRPWAAEASWFRLFGDEHSGHDGTDARYGAQQRGLVCPAQMAL